MEDMRVTYANKTYVAFDADNDIHYYRLMLAWKKNDNTSFNFHDAHDLNNLMKSSSEETIKMKLRERLRNTKVFILLIGNNTRYLYQFVRWEIEQAIQKEIPIIAVNLNGLRFKDTNLCPPILDNELAIHISFHQKIIEYAINDWPNSERNIKAEKRKGSFYYVENTYRRLEI